MLPRILEPELMDSDEDARQYDSMDHSAVNAQFVSDLLAALADRSSDTLKVLDLGAGTAQIPIELARLAPHIQITAADAAQSMLALARKNIDECGLSDRIELMLADAKNMSLDSAAFNAVISNSILHHIPEPRDCLAEAIRVTAPGGLLFHRDLVRPNDESQLDAIVKTYTAEATPYQRQLFADSLHAALTLNEMRELVAEFGVAPETVQMTSDRHWTLSARK